MTLPTCFSLTRAWRPLSLSLVDTIAWEQPKIRVFGRECCTPRLVAWFGDGAYSYSGKAHAAAPMPAWLSAVKADLEALTGARFNSVLLNYYRDGKDSVSWHADDEPELGNSPTIASLSIGASRTFAIKSKDGREKWALPLGGGDLLVMRNNSQRDYLHSIPKTARAIGPRLNLTFRLVSTSR